MTDTPGTHIELPRALLELAALGSLLQRLETQPAGASPEQYQLVASQVRERLAAAQPGPALQALLQALPATAELYENLHYDHAGLVLRALEPALAAERQARALLQRLGAPRPPDAGAADPSGRHAN